MYEYQKETVEQLYKTIDQLENITEDKTKLKIGWCRGKFLNNRYEWVTKSGDLYMALHQNRFLILQDDFVIETMEKIDDDMYIKLDKDIWLRINNWIDKIYADNNKRKTFHEELNKQLKALNKTLEVQA